MRISSCSRNLKWAAGTAAVTICLVGSAGQIAAATLVAGSSRAGVATPTRVGVTLDANTDSAIFAREGKTRDALGFPVGVKRIGQHVRDGFQKAEYDEVTELDSGGNVEAITDFDATGHLRTAVRLDPAPQGGPNVGRDAAIRTAQRSAVAAGLGVGTPSSTDADEAIGGWTIHWLRMQDGVRVRGDETRVQVRPDGRIASVALAQHDLDPAAVRRLGSDDARQVATGNLNSWFAGRNSGYSIQKVDLEWVGPNAAFDPSQVDAPERPYRLAWVTEVKPSGDAAKYVWQISLFVDATDGSIIGGDFVE
jgi:hypothetical protein